MNTFSKPCSYIKIVYVYREVIVTHYRWTLFPALYNGSVSLFPTKCKSMGLVRCNDDKEFTI